MPQTPFLSFHRSASLRRFGALRLLAMVVLFVVLGPLGASTSALAQDPTPLAVGQTVDGALTESDMRLSDGRMMDLFALPVRAGQSVRVELLTSQFQPYLAVEEGGGVVMGTPIPNGAAHTFTPTVDSVILIGASTLVVGGSGAYRLTVRAAGGGAPGSSAGQAAPPPQPAQGPGVMALTVGQTLQGTITTSDEPISANHYFDVFELQLRAGQPVRIELSSRQFDAFLGARGGGVEIDADDGGPGPGDAALDLNVSVDTAVLIFVGGANPGALGAYQLTTRYVGAAQPARPAQAAAPVATGAPAPPVAIAVGQSVDGVLMSGDSRLGSGEYQDVFSLSLRAGQRVRVELASNDFDGYLMARGSGVHLDDDDSGPQPRGAAFDIAVTADTTVQLIVTSNEPGEKGAYRLTVRSTGGAAAPSAAAGAVSANQVTRVATRDPVALIVGQVAQGTLATGDITLASGEYTDEYVLALRAGEHVRVELASTEFDAYLMARGDGIQLDDDDGGPAPRGSKLEIRVDADTRVRVVVTSARAGETGAYRLSILPIGATRGLSGSVQPSRR